MKYRLKKKKNLINVAWYTMCTFFEIQDMNK